MAKTCKFKKVKNRYPPPEFTRCWNITNDPSELCHVHRPGYKSMKQRVKDLEERVTKLEGGAHVK